MRLTTRGRPWHDKRDLDNSASGGPLRACRSRSALPRRPRARRHLERRTACLPFGSKLQLPSGCVRRHSVRTELRTVRNVGGIITAIASRQWPTNIAAAGQGIGQPFENARRIDAVGLRLIGDFIGMTRPSIALQVSAFRSKAGMAFCGGTLAVFRRSLSSRRNVRHACRLAPTDRALTQFESK